MKLKAKDKKNTVLHKTISEGASCYKRDGAKVKYINVSNCAASKLA